MKSTLEEPLYHYPPSSYNWKKSEQPKEKFLLSTEHPWVHSFLLFAVAVVYSTIGGAYYCFPVWLNLILTEHVSISENDLSILGGLPYITLGFFGLLVLYLKTLGFSRSAEFYAGYAVTTISAISSFTIVNWLVRTPRSDGHHVVWAAMALCLIGLSPAGIFLTCWYDVLLSLIHAKYHVLYLSILSIAFVFGALVDLVLKLFMPGQVWVLMILVINIVVLISLWPFILIYRDQFMKNATSTTSTSNENRAAASLLYDFVFWRRNFDEEQLLQSDCDVTSFQFWCMFLAYLGVNSIGTTFMANLGPLTTHNEDTEGDARAAVIVMIWSAAGQTLGRILVPLLDKMFVRLLDPDEMKYLDDEGELLTIQKQEKVHESRLNNRNVLGLTLLIGLVFFSGLIAVKVTDDVDFIVATTILSAGYGMMWSVVANYPLYMKKYAFSFFMSFFQAVGSLGTLIFTLMLSLLRCDNTQIFNALLIGSIVTIGGAGSGFFSRYMAEPKVSKIP